MEGVHALSSLSGTRSHEVDRMIAELAGRQELVVSLAQLQELGLSARAARGRVASGRLFRRNHGVYSLTPQVTRRGEFFAAVLAYSPDAVLSHLSAAAELGIRRHDYGPVHVTVRRTGARSVRGTRIHASPSLPSHAVDVSNHLHVTRAERTLTDLADVLTPSQLQLAVSTAERLGLVDRDTLTTPPGRRRVTKRGHLFTRSGNERAFARLLRRHELPPAKANVELDRWEADFLWPQYGLVVEMDAWHTHGNRRSFETDRLKDAFFDEIGLKVRRVTDTRLHGQPVEVAETVRRALGSCEFVPGRDVFAWTERAVER